MQVGYFRRHTSLHSYLKPNGNSAILAVTPGPRRPEKCYAKQLGLPSPWISDIHVWRVVVICAAGGVSGSSDEPNPDYSDNKLPGQGSRLNSSNGPAGTEGNGPALTLGSEVLERMAKLRALDQYHKLMVEISQTDLLRQQQKQQQQKRDMDKGKQAPAPAAAAANASTALASGDDSSLLLRGALLIARHRYPSLDEGKVYGMLDDIARRVAALLPVDPAERYPLRVVGAINRVLYTDYGFRGNEEDYYNADNSCINQVMERRVGIPITLSLVYSEVARRVGLPMRGLNLPGHFMLQPLWPPARHHPSATSPSLHSGRGSSGGYGREEDQQQQPGSDSGHLVGGLEVQNPQPAAGGGGGDDGGGGGGGAAAAPVAAAANDKSMGMAVTAPAEQKGGTKEAADGDPPFGRAAKQEEEDEEEEDTGGPLEVLVDAFRSGEVCLPGEAEERISAVLGSPVRIDPTVLKESQPLHPRMFLLRMLSNLRSIYLSTQQIELLLDVLKFMRVTLQAEERMEEEEEGGDGGVQGRSHSRSSSPPPFNPTSSFFGDSFPLVAAAASLARDEGLCYFALRRYPECLEALREYLRLAEQTGNGPLPAEEAKTVAVVMEEARRRMTQQRQ